MINDILASIALFVGALYLYFDISSTKAIVQGSNSLLLPKLMVTSLIIISLILGIRGYINRKSVVKDYDRKKNYNLDNNKKLLLVIIITGIYLYSITLVGYFIITPIYFYVFSYVLGYKKVKVKFINAISITILVYMLFVKVLYIPLPMGIGAFKRISELIMY